ncbi:MAG: hypothetical protein RLZZ292_558 [Bacteroidota bacterium]|jgi:hypothetical protein
MKNILFASLLLLSLYSCHKTTEGYPIEKTAIATLNGLIWNAKGRLDVAENKGKIDLFIGTNDSAGEQLGTLHIANIPCKKGTYKISKLDFTSTESTNFPHGTYYNHEGGDLIISSYEIVESKKNEVEITYINNRGTVAEGTFNLTFFKINGFETEPDTIVFKDGKFNLKK